MRKSSIAAIVTAICWVAVLPTATLKSQEKGRLEKEGEQLGNVEPARRGKLAAKNPSILNRRADVVFRTEDLHEGLDKLKADFKVAIAETYKLPIRLDRVSLADVGLGPRELVTVEFSETDLHSALSDMLSSVSGDLSYHIDHEMVVVTTQEAIDESLSIMVYPVSDLTRDGEDFDMLMDNITSSVYPTSWEETGGPGAVEPWPFEPALVVAQTAEVHRKIADLLAQLREVNAQLGEDESPEKPADARQDEYSTVVFRLWQPWDEKARVKEEAVVKLLQEMIEPESWLNEEVFVKTLPSRLIIRQKKSIHRQIYQSLINLAILQPEAAPSGPGGLGGGLGGGGFDSGEGFESGFGSGGVGGLAPEK